MNGVALFTWLQATRFYRQVHAEAVALVPRTGGRWIDVGCGPGLVAFLAAERGFRAEGWDPAGPMVAAARAIARRSGSPARFDVRGLDALAAERQGAAVVSAASLLAVLPDRGDALEALWAAVEPRGTLLIVEPTSAMRPWPVWRQAGGQPALGLLLWALARRGRSCAATLDAWSPPRLAARSFTPLLGGLVGAWLFRRDASRPHSGAPL